MRQSIIVVVSLFIYLAAVSQVSLRNPSAPQAMILTSETYPCSGTSVFSEDFEGGIPSGWEIWDFDTLAPAPSTGLVAGWQSLADYRDSTNKVAASPSWYLPKGASNDWLVSPAINLTTKNCLSWKAYSQDGSFKESYSVYIATAKDTTSFLADSAVYATEGESGSPVYNNIDLSDWAGQTVYIAFRQTSNDQFVLVIDDVNVVEANSRDAGITRIDSIYAQAFGKNKIIGAFSNFALDSLEQVTVSWKIGGSSTKSMTLTGLDLKVGRTWSFLHDSSFVPTALGAYDICFWTSQPNGLSDQNNANDTICFQTFVFQFVGLEENPVKEMFVLYPNPASDVAVIRPGELAIYSWELTDLSGRRVSAGDFNGNEWQIDLSGLQAGIYFVSVSDESGNHHTQKLIKR